MGMGVGDEANAMTVRDSGAVSFPFYTNVTCL